MVYVPEPGSQAAAYRFSSGPTNAALELEYLYVLMLRQTKAATSGVVTLKYAVLRCMAASGAHQKATASRLRKGFLGDMIGARSSGKRKPRKGKPWVAQRAKVDAFDWQLHEEMRRLKGFRFTGSEVDIKPPDGQLLGEAETGLGRVETKAEENLEHQGDELSEEEVDWSDEEELERDGG